VIASEALLFVFAIRFSELVGKAAAPSGAKRMVVRLHGSAQVAGRGEAM
jgi:hypothetical protein